MAIESLRNDEFFLGDLATGTQIMRGTLIMIAKKNHREHLPQAYNYADMTMSRILARRIGEEGTKPIGVVMATELLIHDCTAPDSSNSHTDPLPDEIVGLDPRFYSDFRGKVTEFAKAGVSDLFGYEVELDFRKVYDQLRTMGNPVSIFSEPTPEQQ